MENETFDPIAIRQAEVAQYEANIAIYKSMVDSLPSEWPDRLLHLQGSKNPHQDIDLVEPEDIELVSQLWAHDSAKHSIRTEMVELAKARAILAALEAQAE